MFNVYDYLEPVIYKFAYLIGIIDNRKYAYAKLHSI